MFYKSRHRKKLPFNRKTTTLQVLFLVVSIVACLSAIRLLKPIPATVEDGNGGIVLEGDVSETPPIPDTFAGIDIGRYRDRTGLLIVVKKSDPRLFVLRDGVFQKTYRVAVGKNKGDKERPGDMRTPEGEFSVTQIQNASYWTHDFNDGKGVIEGAYGPLFLRLATPPWQGIGIHGTHDPDSLGQEATEGCIRMHNDDLLELREIVDIGTPVIIES